MRPPAADRERADHSVDAPGDRPETNHLENARAQGVTLAPSPMLCNIRESAEREDAVRETVRVLR